MRLVEDNPSSLSLVEIYKQRCTKKGIEHDSPISRYYDRLATVQARGTQASHQVSRALGSYSLLPFFVFFFLLRRQIKFQSGRTEGRRDHLPLLWRASEKKTNSPKNPFTSPPRMINRV